MMWTTAVAACVLVVSACGARQVVPEATQPVTTSGAAVTPNRPPCSESLNDDACLAAMGMLDVGAHGQRCACPMPDGGKPCSAPSDCVTATCEIPYEAAVVALATRCDDTGCAGPRAA